MYVGKGLRNSRVRGDVIFECWLGFTVNIDGLDLDQIGGLQGQNLQQWWGELLHS